MKNKIFVGLMFILVELLLMWFFSSIGYLIHKDITLIYVVCGLILLSITPFFYIMWEDYPNNDSEVKQ